jgi:DNA-binding XRE family transcriptional regulator
MLKKILITWRSESCFSQKDAAKVLNIPFNTYISWEQGKRKPKGTALTGLIAMLFLDKKDLLQEFKSFRENIDRLLDKGK